MISSKKEMVQKACFSTNPLDDQSLLSVERLSGFEKLNPYPVLHLPSVSSETVTFVGTLRRYQMVD